jgi:hypothetical protein
MAVDQVCVVTSSDPRQCQNQDILFLGTGKLYHISSSTYLVSLAFIIVPVKFIIADKLSCVFILKY